ncbi:mechanosensitive ion channel family protein [Neisseria sp.]|uniref:mechanosensitive ion channel family protein n=1 Tax=Neisseria sp. TaxID=192066 RepID=UPI0026DD8EF6|nr:mechanosensitive ion channel domain-containing protein [Neisseria sp.]MDO4907270.1 mechanosensitive ion channel [Neisseria sp.]
MLNLSDTGLQEIENSGISNFISGLFARREFTAQLLEHSFNRPSGWLEAALAAAIIAATFWLSGYWIGRKPAAHPHWGAIRHIGQRILWPVLMLAAAVAAIYFWQLSGQNPLWLQLLAMAARWMILIRFALAVLRAALPANKITDWLERFLSSALWIVFVLWVSGIEAVITGAMKTVELPVGTVRLNLYTVLTGLLWVAVVMVFALWLARFINNKLMASQRLDINLRIVLSKIISTAMIVLSFLIALPLVGIDLTVLSVFGGALGVGIGFGLQKVASNYISGFIILGDRSIRPGDRLTVDGFTGYVTKITSRFVVLKSATGAEALIPNETFITSTVINESYTSKSLWQSLDVQVAYHTDLTKALSLLEEAAAAQERVDTSPAPKAVVLGFGDNGIDLRIGFWVKDPENGFAALFSAILLGIWQRFNKHGIEFPFPQREVRILNETQTPGDAAILKASLKSQTDTRSDAAFDDGN